MIAQTIKSAPLPETPANPRSVAKVLGALDGLAAASKGLIAQPRARFEVSGGFHEIPRYVFIGPDGGDTPIRVGIFAGVHGDEPEGIHALVRFLQFLEKHPGMARGYALSIYPVCNPIGYEAGTRFNGGGKDLNREFWRNSAEPEIKILEAELSRQTFDGIIALHTDHESQGFYGFARGATLTKQLLRPALAVAAQLLPINEDEKIDGFHAREGLIEDCYEGVLTAPPRSRPKPFEIILEAPGQVPMFLREAALVMTLRSVLDEYRKFIAYAPNL